MVTFLGSSPAVRPYAIARSADAAASETKWARGKPFALLHLMQAYNSQFVLTALPNQACDADAPVSVNLSARSGDESFAEKNGELSHAHPSREISFEVSGLEAWQLELGKHTKTVLLFALRDRKKWVAWYAFYQALDATQTVKFDLASLGKGKYDNELLFGRWGVLSNVKAHRPIRVDQFQTERRDANIVTARVVNKDELEIKLRVTPSVFMPKGAYKGVYYDLPLIFENVAPPAKELKAVWGIVVLLKTVQSTDHPWERLQAPPFEPT
jgi:hypothetical protein